MNYEFKKLSEVESLNEVPENATVLAEVDGTIKRIPSSGLGGTFKTAIIKQYGYDDAVAILSSGGGDGGNPSVVSSDSDIVTFDCINMTFEEAYEIMAAGEPLDVILMSIETSQPSTIVTHAFAAFTGIYTFGIPVIVLGDNNITLFWTPDGISINPPGGGGAE